MNWNINNSYNVRPTLTYNILTLINIVETKRCMAVGSRNQPNSTDTLSSTDTQLNWHSTQLMRLNSSQLYVYIHKPIDALTHRSFFSHRFGVVAIFGADEKVEGNSTWAKKSQSAATKILKYTKHSCFCCRRYCCRLLCNFHNFLYSTAQEDPNKHALQRPSPM